MRAAFLVAFVAAFPALGAGVLEKNHPLVAEGMAAAANGNFEEALEKYDAAAKQLPPRAQLEFDRAHALFKLNRLDEAKAALAKAAELDPKGELTNSIQYNLGNVLAAQKDTTGALAAYRKALRAKPDDAQARHNMELLLTDPPPPPKPSPDGGTDGGQDAGQNDAGKPDAGRPDGGQDGGQDGGRDAGSGDAGRGDGGNPAPNPGQGDAGSDGGSSDGGGGSGKDGAGKDAGQGESSGDANRFDGGQAGKDAGASNDARPAKGVEDGGSNMPKSEAERLLDAMKNSEKNLQLWRFQQGKTKRRAPHEKDW